MSAMTAGQVLAAAAANMVKEDDVTGTLIRLLSDAEELLGANALAAIVRDQQGRLEVLGSTSHAVEDLEAFQIQQDEGPCVDCVMSGTQEGEYQKDEILTRWPRVGPAIATAGYHSVFASPLHWHGRTFGALNAFAQKPGRPTAQQLRLAQSVADTAALLIMSSGHTDSQRLDKQIEDALACRALVEQAKGVIAHQQSVDMAQAYRELLHLAHLRASSITRVAETVMTDARNGRYRHRP